MHANKLTTGTLTPAYGRDYRNARDARTDFEAGKDFVLNTFNGSGYVGRADFADGARIVLRYGQLRKVTTHVVGSTVSLKARKGQ